MFFDLGVDISECLIGDSGDKAERQRLDGRFSWGPEISKKAEESVKGTRGVTEVKPVESAASADAAKAEPAKPEVFRVPLMVNLPHPTPVNDYCEKTASADERLKLVPVQTHVEVLTSIQAEGGGILLYTAQTQDQINGLIELIRVTRGLIHTGQLTIAVLGNVKNRNFVDRLTKIGVQEVLPLEVQAKVLSFKMKKLIDKVYGRAKARFDKANGKVTEAKAEKKGVRTHSGRAQEKSSQLDLKMESELPQVADCWLTERGGAVRVMGRIRVKLTGPGDVLGEWRELPHDKGPKNKPKDARDNYWEWVPDAKYRADYPLIDTDGFWVFEGDRPELQGRIWSFAGRNPELSYWMGTEFWAKKFWIEGENTLILRKDPANAPRVLELIRKSLELATKVKSYGLRAKGKIKEAEALEAAAKAEEQNEREAEQEIKKTGKKTAFTVQSQPEGREASEVADEDVKPEETEAPSSGFGKATLFSTDSAQGTEGSSAMRLKSDSEALSDVMRAKGGPAEVHKDRADSISGDGPQAQWGNQTGSEARESTELAGRFASEKAREIGDKRGPDERAPPLVKSKMAEDAEASEREAPLADVKAAMAAVKKNLGVGETFRKAREKKAQQKPHVPGKPYEPLFKPLSLALLFSEIVSSQRVLEADRANRCARLLTESVEGSVFELWIKGPSGWTCAGSSTGGQAPVRGLEFLERAGLQEPEIIDGAAAVVPLAEGAAAWVGVGASAADVPMEFWKAVALISRTLPKIASLAA